MHVSVCIWLAMYLLSLTPIPTSGGGGGGSGRARRSTPGVLFCLPDEKNNRPQINRINTYITVKKIQTKHGWLEVKKKLEKREKESTKNKIKIKRRGGKDGKNEEKKMQKVLKEEPLFILLHEPRPDVTHSPQNSASISCGSPCHAGKVVYSIFTAVQTV